MRHTYPLLAAATRIGRLPDNDIVLDSGNVSRHHAVIVDTGTSFVITDGAQQFGALPPGPPPSWTPPGSGSGGGNKGPLLALAAVGGVILLGLIAVGLFFAFGKDDKNASGPTTNSTTSSSERSTTSRAPRTTTSRPSENPDSFEAKIFVVIPSTYPASGCTTVTPPGPGALATVDCEKSGTQNGPESARYSLYPTAVAMNDAFTGLVGANDETVPCPGNTKPGPVDWGYHEDDVAGQIACGTFQGNADITWSFAEQLIVADIQNHDLVGLHDWWLNN